MRATEATTRSVRIRGSGVARRAGWLRTMAACLAVAALAVLTVSAVASAAPVWRINALANPTAAPGTQMRYIVQLTNDGDRFAPDFTLPEGRGNTSNCTPGAPLPADPTNCITVSIDLPPGITGVSAGASGSWPGTSCLTTASNVTCTNPGNSALRQVNTGSGGDVGQQQLVVTVDVAPDVSGAVTSSFSVSGGDASADTTVDSTVITPDPPAFGVGEFDGQLTTDASGTRGFTQAGGHPYDATTVIEFNSFEDPLFPNGNLLPVEPVKDVIVDLPPGFVGDPTAVDQCADAQLAGGGLTPRPDCPPSSQVGTVIVHVDGTGGAVSVIGPLPVFNLIPPADAPARFGFNVLGTIVTLNGRVRSDSDYGVSVDVEDVSQGLAVQATDLTLWGFPAEASHDALRACAGDVAPSGGGAHCASGRPLKAFLRNPTSCTPAGVGLPTTVHVDSWFHPGTFVSRTFMSHEPPGYPAAPADWGPEAGTTGCDRVPFTPTLLARPEAGARAGQPSGFSFDLSLPQSSDLGTVGQSDLREAVVTLPEGVRVSPGSADGLAGCSSDQIALHKTDLPTCPAGSKIGTLTIDTPVLDQPLTGGIYLATPFDNPSRSLIGVYLVASGAGVVVKLAGKTEMDPKTGRITATFDNNPQLPFSNLHLEFKGGPRAPLTLPHTCGVHTTHAVLTGWNGRTVEQDSSFTLTQDARGQPCPSTFTPGFDAGAADPIAGKSTTFSLRLTRDDEDQDLRALTVTMPQGLLGYVSRAVLCSADDAARGTCHDGSKIGSVTVGAGAGTSPFFITNGRAYLTGPYNGAPFGLSIVVPAVAGPFDLGNVVVRSSLFVDKHDSSLRVVSDPLPTILQGIPLDVRDVRVTIDKAGFMVNPTSCAAKSIGGVIESTEGARANVSSKFQVGECGNLGFRPRIVMRVGGRGHTRRGQTSAFSTTVTMPSRNQANLRFVRVTLPTTINARLNTINDACTRAEFESDIAKCAHAKAGSATALTPLLRDPLKGDVFFVKNGHPIPDLFVALRGQVAFDLIGRVSIPGGKHLATTFDAAPDVPIRSFSLRLLGGPSTASIGAAANLCSARGRRAKAAVDYIGQNGKVLQVDQRLQVAGCAKHRPHGRR